jgi:hypothetical protein
MDPEAVTSRNRRAFALVVVFAACSVLAAWIPAPIIGMTTVLLQGWPAWLR